MRPAEPAKSSRASGFTLVELPAVSKDKEAALPLVELPAVSKRAFTLVELLVVIGIIAVLLAVLLPVLNQARRQALCVQCQSNLRQLLQASQQYANDNNNVMPGYDSTNTFIFWNAPNAWWLTLAQYLAPPDFNPTDLNHNQVAVYNCPACPTDLRQTPPGSFNWYNLYPVTYAISWFASDTMLPQPPYYGPHNVTYQYTKYNTWLAPNFILFADSFPGNAQSPGGLGPATQFIPPPWGGALFGASVAFYHGSGDWIWPSAKAPSRTNAGFLDGHVESLTAEDFLRNYLSAENAARCPGPPTASGPGVFMGNAYIQYLAPYGGSSQFYNPF